MAGGAAPERERALRERVALLGGFVVDGLGAGIGAAIVTGLVSWVAGWFIGGERRAD